MTLAEKIRSMSDEEIARMLWRYSVNCISSFLMHGGEEIKNFVELKRWVREEYDPHDRWLRGTRQEGGEDAGADMDSDC